ncbi:MAG: hypothetical protein HQK87_06905 [Nitrospinae bacterium]|nr:hypothetical protein [Nitrospinota bacterium]
MSQRISGECPIVSSDDDLLGFTSKAENLSTTLLNSTPPVMIGLFSPWGSGKTSMLNLVKDQIGRDGDFRRLRIHHAGILPVFFDTWDHEDSLGLIPKLVLRIADEIERSQYGLEGKVDDLKQSAGRVAGAVLLTLLDVGVRSATMGMVDTRLIESAKNYASGEKDPESWAKKVQRNPHHQLAVELADLMTKVRSYGYSRVALLIDDIDRCHPENVFDFLDNIRRLLTLTERVRGERSNPQNLAGFVGIIAADEKILSSSIQARYPGADPDVYGHLAKLITIRQRIPTPDKWALTNFLTKKILPAAGDTANYAKVIDCLATVASSSSGSLTPRHVLSVMRQYAASFIPQENANPVGPFTGTAFDENQTFAAVSLALFSIVDPPRCNILFRLHQEGMKDLTYVCRLALSCMTDSSSHKDSDRGAYHRDCHRSLDEDWRGCKHVHLFKLLYQYFETCSEKTQNMQFISGNVVNAAMRIAGSA